MIDDNDINAVDQLRKDAPKLKLFRDCLFELVKEGLSNNTVTYQDALTHANTIIQTGMTRTGNSGSRGDFEFKNVKSLQDLKFTESWWEKFKRKYQNVDGDSTPDSMPFKVHQDMTPLTTEEKYEIFKFKNQNPEMAFNDLAQLFSEKFQAGSSFFTRGTNLVLYKSKAFRLPPSLVPCPLFFQ